MGMQKAMREQRWLSGEAESDGSSEVSLRSVADTLEAAQAAVKGVVAFTIGSVTCVLWAAFAPINEPNVSEVPQATKRD